MGSRILFSFLIGIASAVASLEAPGAAPEFVRLINRGKAHLENKNSAKAIEAFTAALTVEPNSALALRDLARAQMLADQNDEALKQLAAAQSQEKESAATSYLLGLAHVHKSRFEQAVPFLEEAVRLDAHTATLRFQLANAYQFAQQHDKAQTQYRETVRLDPLHASAHFKLATYAARAGERAEYDRQHQEFQRLRKLFSEDTRTPQALERCLYTLPEPAPVAVGKPSPSIKVRFTDASRETFADDAARSATTAAVLEVDANGVSTVFVVDASGAAGLLKMSAPGKFTRIPVSPTLSGRGPFHDCLGGDFFNDVPKGVKYDPEVHALNDVFLLGTNGCALLKRTGPASFDDVTAQAGLAEASGTRAQWVDYDHDGDIDLTVAAAVGLQLWQNNGDASFTNVTQQVGIAGATAATDVTAVDFDANVAIDLVIARAAEPTLVFMNQRAGQFTRLPEPPGPWPPARRVLTDDLDNDGHADALLLADTEAVVMFGQRAGRKRFAWSGLAEPVVALLDYDNDGWLDFCAASSKPASSTEVVLRLWRNTANGEWADVTELSGLASVQVAAVRDLIPADLDNDGDTDLLLVSSAGRLHFLRNDGGNANGQLKVRLLGTKTNPTGLGTRVEVRTEEFVATRSVSRLPIEIGLGQRKQLDSVQTVWSNGIVDNQIDVDVKPPPLTIPEKNVAAGSCPYLYAWDGKGVRFVTDLLGNSPLGLSMRRGAVLPADPDEIVFVGTEKDFKPRRGFFELEVTEELREVLYLDEAHLIAVDHPPDVEVHSTDKLGPTPFPPSELWALRSPRLPVSVVGDDGIDRTEAVRAIDGVFAAPGPQLPPPLRGQCQPLTLTMDFGLLGERTAGVPARSSTEPPSDRGQSTGQLIVGAAAGGDARAPFVLALTGWLQYGDASANIASSQNSSLPVIPPKLEAETARGEWQRLDVVIGMPAGKTKTILCDLTGKLPRGAQRLRLTTTFEIRWDRIALFERAPESEISRHALKPARAHLRWRGFSEIKSRAPGHPQTPAYDKVSPRPPWRTTPEGWCTRYGDVFELVNQRDDQLVLVNAGDALRLRFAEKSLPPVSAGRVRTFFFHSVGWDKDADHNVIEGDTVEPLPVVSRGDWQARYNTRWVARDMFVVPASAGQTARAAKALVESGRRPRGRTRQPPKGGTTNYAVPER